MKAKMLTFVEIKTRAQRLCLVKNYDWITFGRSIRTFECLSEKNSHKIRLKIGINLEKTLFFMAQALIRTFWNHKLVLGKLVFLPYKLIPYLKSYSFILWSFCHAFPDRYYTSLCIGAYYKVLILLIWSLIVSKHCKAHFLLLSVACFRSLICWSRKFFKLSNNLWLILLINSSSFISLIR